MVICHGMTLPLQKHGGEDGPALSFATKYLYRATYHLNVKPLSFQLGETDTEIWFLTVNLNTTNGCFYNNCRCETSG